MVFWWHNKLYLVFNIIFLGHQSQEGKTLNVIYHIQYIDCTSFMGHGPDVSAGFVVIVCADVLMGLCWSSFDKMSRHTLHSHTGLKADRWPLTSPIANTPDCVPESVSAAVLILCPWNECVECLMCVMCCWSRGQMQSDFSLLPFPVFCVCVSLFKHENVSVDWIE